MMKNKFQIPSNKIKILLGVALFVVLYSIVDKYKLFFYNEPKPDQKQELVNTKLDTESNEIVTLDTDSDGLPDWQEIITGTDPKKQDTDNDGTLDSKELELGRDPLVSGPNDKSESLMSKTSTTTNDALTVSDSVSRNLFANAVYLSNNGNVTDENKANLVNNLINTIQNSFTFKEYTIQSVLTLTNANQNSIRFYASNVATLQIGMLLQMENNILKIENDLGVLADIYSKQAKDLSELNVPIEILNTHLELVNNFSKASSVFEAIANEKNDPLKLPFAIRTYQDIIIAQPELLRTISQFLDKNGIIFSNNEAGGYWNAYK